jgi:hypothetical protein
MDQYGSFQNTKRDALEIKAQLRTHETIVISYSGDQVGAMLLLLCDRFTRVGVMPFGGNPDGRIYVGVYGFGCSHFSRQPTHYSYFMEKLKIGECEAKWLEELWENLFGETIERAKGVEL